MKCYENTRIGEKNHEDVFFVKNCINRIISERYEFRISCERKLNQVNNEKLCVNYVKKNELT